MKRFLCCAVFLSVALGIGTAQAAITWDGQFSGYDYPVDANRYVYLH